MHIKIYSAFLLYLIAWSLKYFLHYGNSLAWPNSRLLLPGTPHIISTIISRPQRAAVASSSSATINQMSDLIWLPGITVPEKCSPLFNMVSCYCHKSSHLCLYHHVHNLLNCQTDNIHKDKDAVCRCGGVWERRRENSNHSVSISEKWKYM